LPCHAPYQWSTVEISTQNPVDGQKIDHLHFPVTTHQWSTVDISTQIPVNGQKIDHLDFTQLFKTSIEWSESNQRSHIWRSVHLGIYRGASAFIQWGSRLPNLCCFSWEVSDDTLHWLFFGLMKEM
jgi:hypothetical protein